MKPQATMASITLLVMCAVATLTSGCGHLRRAHQLYQPPPPPAPLGALVDPVWENQEANAEASDFVVYQHEFDVDTARLNLGGQDHVKQIAARLHVFPDSYVIVERSMTTPREDTEFQYPVHPSPKLDMRRREVVAMSLAAMGIPDATDRVVIAPAIAQAAEASEAQTAYQRGLRNRGFFGGGLFNGGGFGLFGGGFRGGFGGF